LNPPQISQAQGWATDKARKSRIIGEYRTSGDLGFEVSATFIFVNPLS
jgi:hypothetical protein